MADYTKDIDVTIPTIPSIAETVDTKTLPNQQVSTPDIPGIAETVDTKTLPNYQITVPTIPSIENTVEEVEIETTLDRYLIKRGAAFFDYTDEANEDTDDDVPLYVAAGDTIYIANAAQVYAIEFKVTTAGSGTYTFAIPQYYNGFDWVNLNAAWGEINSDDFKTIDTVRCAWSIPDDEEKVVVNGENFYWYRFVGSGTITVAPLAGRVKILTESVDYEQPLNDKIDIVDNIDTPPSGIDYEKNPTDNISLSDSIKKWAPSIFTSNTPSNNFYATLFCSILHFC